jgi:hypothetical protein
MKNLTLAFMVAMAFVSFGCKKKGGGGAGEAMAKMSEFKNEMCACKDAKCAQEVSDKMTKWSQEQSKNQKEPPKMSEEDTKKAAAIGEEMGKCMQAAMGAPAAGDPAAAGSADPAAAGSADPAAAGSAAPAGSADPAAAGGSAAAPAGGSAAAPAEKK